MRYVFGGEKSVWVGVNVAQRHVVDVAPAVHHVSFSEANATCSCSFVFECRVRQQTSANVSEICCCSPRCVSTVCASELGKQRPDSYRADGCLRRSSRARWLRFGAFGWLLCWLQLNRLDRFDYCSCSLCTDAISSLLLLLFEL